MMKRNLIGHELFWLRQSCQLKFLTGHISTQSADSDENGGNRIHRGFAILDANIASIGSEEREERERVLFAYAGGWPVPGKSPTLGRRW